MKSVVISCFIFLMVCAGTLAGQTPTAAPTSLELSWRVTGLASPESVELSADGSFLYVTNVNGEGDARDGNGFISRVSVTGTLLEREWAGGLNAPKGIARFGDALYVADIDEIVVLDAASGALRARHAAPGARFLNDIAVTASGLVLAADSDTQRIYALQEGEVAVWFEDPILNSINGLLAETSRLIVTTMRGRLIAVDYASHSLTMLAEGLGDADGIAPLANGRYLVSEWPGLLHVVAADGTHTTILDSREQGRFLNDFLLVGNTLYQPHWEPGELSAYILR